MVFSYGLSTWASLGFLYIFFLFFLAFFWADYILVLHPPLICSLVAHSVVKLLTTTLQMTAGVLDFPLPFPAADSF